MKVLIARLRSLNLAKPGFYDSTCLSNGAKDLLSISPITGILNRGAKTVDCGITWVRPTDPSCISKEVSGDLESIPKIPSDLVVAELRNSQVFKK